MLTKLLLIKVYKCFQSLFFALMSFPNILIRKKRKDVRYIASFTSLSKHPKTRHNHTFSIYDYCNYIGDHDSLFARAMFHKEECDNHQVICFQECWKQWDLKHSHERADGTAHPKWLRFWEYSTPSELHWTFDLLDWQKSCSDRICTIFIKSLNFFPYNITLLGDSEESKNDLCHVIHWFLLSILQYILHSFFAVWLLMKESSCQGEAGILPIADAPQSQNHWCWRCF